MTGRNDILITGANCITALGLDGKETACSVLRGESGIAFDDQHEDEYGSPVKTSVIRGLDMAGTTGEAEFMAILSRRCLSELCQRCFAENETVEHLHLFMGYPSGLRPGPRFEMAESPLETCFKSILSPYAENVYVNYFITGNASAFHGIRQSTEILGRHQDSVCIVGAADSLLSPETIAWFQKDSRLVSETPGRGQGLFPSQATGFFILDSERGLEKRNKKPLARLISHCIAQEPAPFASGTPCCAEGLTRVIQKTLEYSQIHPTSVHAVLCDLNGEYHKFKEWGFAGMRCFPESSKSPGLIHPADCLGDVGAAWLPVLLNIAVEGFRNDTLVGNVMIFCSDDHGERGALVLCKGDAA